MKRLFPIWVFEKTIKKPLTQLGPLDALNVKSLLHILVDLRYIRTPIMGRSYPAPGVTIISPRLVVLRLTCWHTKVIGPFPVFGAKSLSLSPVT